MLTLRKGTTTVAQYASAYDLAEDLPTLQKIAGKDWQKLQHQLQVNAFSMCIIGAKMRLGNGYVLQGK